MKSWNCGLRNWKKLIEGALRESEERHRLFFENAPIGIIHYSKQGNITAVNDAMVTTFGSSREKLIGLNIDQIPDKNFTEKVHQSLMGQSGYFEGEYCSYTGRKTAYVKAAWIPIKRKDKIIAGVGIVEDITARKQAVEALDSEKERLAVTLRSIGDAVIATDRSGRVTLMNPVAENLTGWPETEAKGRPLAEVFHIVNEITGQPCANPVQQVPETGKIQELSNHTLLINRDGSNYSIADSAAPIMEAGQTIIGFVLVFRDITAAQRTEAELLKMEKLKSLGVLAGGIAHDFNNFLTGIIAISGKNTAVAPDHHLKLTPGPYVRIMVRDQGTGIKKEHLNRIFDPYFTTKQKGSGLGLTIVYSIIEKHDGHVAIDSKLGRGTTFNLYLPASPGSALQKVAPEAAVTSGSGRILVMDDEEFIRTLATEMLSKLGYETALAKDGAEAIKLYRDAMGSDQPFDAVILDLTVPGGIGGRETMARLTQIDEDVKAIVSSGYSNDPVMSKYRDHGFIAAVSKPYVILELSDALKKV